MLLILDGGDAGRDGGTRHVERPAHAVQRIDDRRRPHRPSEPKRGEPVNLGEGARHQHVRRFEREREAGIVIGTPEIFRIGGIQHQEHMARQSRMQPENLGIGQIGAGRIVGVGEEDDPRARRHKRQHRIHVGGVVALGGDHRGRARGQRRDAIHQEAVLGEQAFIARPEIGLGGDGQQFVRTRAADDAIGIYAMGRADGFAQQHGAAIGIIRQKMRRLQIGRPRMAARAVGRLVGGELEHLGDAGRLAAAGHIGVDGQHARTGHGHGMNVALWRVGGHV